MQDDDKRRIDDHRFINDDEFEDIVTNMDIINHIEKDGMSNKDHNDDWKFKSIIRYRAPLVMGDKEYKRSRYNMLIN